MPRSKKAEQEKQATVAAAKRAVEEAKRLVDEAQAQAAAAGARPRQAPGQLSIEGAKAAQPQEAPKAPRRRKNPLRHQEEYEQEGFVSFFEKK